MSKLYLDPAAEKEANDIGKKFMNSSDVVGDMSRAYGADLSSVKIHTDDGAASKAAERGVDAFSTGKDVFFARGAFDQSDPASRGLLAHELSHSLQQGVGGEMAGTAQSAPMGAAQGGLVSWFRNRKAKKRQAQEQAAAPAPAPAPAPQLLYDEEFGEEGFDASVGSSGYVLPSYLVQQNKQRAPTRFGSKEARDLYVGVLNNPQLLKLPEVRKAMTDYYETEMQNTFGKYTDEKGEKNTTLFSNEVMRGQKSGGMRIMSSLLNYHANGDFIGKVAEGYTYEDKGSVDLSSMPDGEEKYNLMMKLKAGPDITQQMNQLTDATESNEELMNLLMLHSSTLGNSGFVSKEAADSQALNDFGIRALGPNMADLNAPYDEKEKTRRRQLGNLIQKELPRKENRNAGTKRFQNLLRRRRGEEEV